MKFWDREKEKKWLKHYLLTEPNAILFVYGPKSSGKTTLLMKVVEELPKEKFIYYWFDLREKFIVGYESVVEIFFKEKGWLESFVKAIKPKINLGVFELEPEVLSGIRQKRRDPFEEMRKRLEEDRSKGLTPVIVFDELQKLKDIYLNGDSQRPLVKELFNFFVRLTKVLHLSHVIVMTSDTFFIEQVYTDSTLVNTSRFYLVDFFDDETAREILISEGISESDASYIVDHIGGVPWMMEEILESDSPISELERLYKDSRGAFLETLDRIYEEGWYEDAAGFLKDLLTSENFEVKRESKKVLRRLVDYEILFYDPVEREVKFHSKLYESVAKEILGSE